MTVHDDLATLREYVKRSVIPAAGEHSPTASGAIAAMARHTYATWWLQNGGRLETLSKQLGHARSSTTQDEYVHLERADVLADLAVIEGRA